VVDVAEGVEGDAVLGEDGEEGVGRVINESSGEDKHGGSTVGALGGDKPAVKNALGTRDVGGKIRVDMDVVEGQSGRGKSVAKGEQSGGWSW
jgi:hypothetical protein